MRISDWSSDVCSSDLPAAGGVLPLGLGRQATARPFRIGLRILWRNLHHGMRLSPFDGTLRPFRVAPVGTGAEMPPLHDVGHAGDFLWHDEDNGARLQQFLRPVRVLCRIGTRPEEHTSELQSLMRNSYAVLCMQQKN